MRIYETYITYGYCNEGGEVGGMGAGGGGKYITLEGAVRAGVEGLNNLCSGMSDGRGPLVIEISFTDETDTEYGAAFSYYGSEWTDQVTDFCIEHFVGVNNCDDWVK